MTGGQGLCWSSRLCVSVSEGVEGGTGRGSVGESAERKDGEGGEKRSR